VSPDVFAEWLVEDQLSYLETALSPANLEQLWHLCAGGVDSGPIVHLAGLAAGRGMTLAGNWLLALRPSTLAAVLVVEGLAVSAQQAWSAAVLPDIVSFCLLDRYLRRHDIALWESLVEDTEAQAEALLAAGADPSEGLLMRLQGVAQQELKKRHPQAWKAWTPAWLAAVRSAIKTLAERPRDVSQANAERLLSQQVYTDPGHFLLELLQNADDAGASRFSVDFGEDALTIRHDGAPFDFRDLVGVLSIGQTTKKSTQIGYFGVGFKSVFEVTERPRMYSGHFAFEIADISVPRGLAPQDNGEETVLVLPLKRGLDSLAYWRKAVEIQPALLLNVPHLRRLSWQGPETVEVSLSEAEGEVMVLRHRGGESRYLLWSGVYRHQGARPPGKPAQAEVHLAIPVGDQPEAGLAPLGTSLYSFLPISEQSGLSFIVGSHFDVPVDRERLDVTSLWNQGVIATVPEILAQRFAADPARGWGLLSSLPLPEDPLAPLFTTLPARLAQALADVALLPGGRHARDVQLLEPELEELFELTEQSELLCPKDERKRRWLELLGARLYNHQSLLAELAQGVLPGRLAGRRLDDWSRLHALLANSSFDLVDAPIFLDAALQPASSSAAILLDQEWHELFIAPPRSIHAGLATLPDSAALLAKLGTTRFDWASLVQELQAHGTANLHLEKLFERLTEAPRGVTLACLELPIFPDQHGKLGPLVPNAARHLGVVAPISKLPTSLMPEVRFLGNFAALERLLDTLRWPRFDLPALVEALEWQKLNAEQADLLLTNIEASEAPWTGPQLERLASLSIFESTGGERLPLSQLWCYEDEGLAALLRDRPELAQASLSARVVEKLGQEHRLSRADLDIVLAQLPGPEPQAALHFLASRAQRLSRAQIERLFALPMFAGHPLVWPDNPLGRGPMAARPGYVELLTALGRKLLDSSTTETLLPLLQACAYPLLGLTQLVEMLEVTPPPPDLLPKLHEVLRGESAGLQLAFSKELRQSLPVWLTRSGRVVPSVDIPPNQELAFLTGRLEWQPLEPPDAGLAELFPLLEADAYLRRVLSSEAWMEQPLSAQPDWCDSVAKVDQVAAHLPLAFLMVSAEGVLRDTSLHQAPPLSYPWLLRSPLGGEMIHPESSVEQRRDCQPLEAVLVLETYFPLRHEPGMRKAFYAYLQAELGTIASQPEARSFLLEVALWRSAGGHWKSLDQLILDPEIPDLGGDWNPHPEIPTDLLTMLETVLGVGRPEPLTMLADHLLPAYLQRPSSRASILDVMARLARGVENSTLRRLLREPDGKGSFPLPSGGDLQQAYHPPEELAELRSLPAVKSEQLAFLRRLGLRYLPSARALQGLQLSFDDGDSLLRLVEWAWQQQPDELEPLWDILNGVAWMPARDSTLKLPRQLFVRSPEIEELVGSSPELFVQRRLPVGLARRLGLKEESELDATLVLQQLRRLVARQERVSGRMYGYLEESLRSGRLSSHYLLEQLKGVPWVWADEGEYRLARQVLAVPSFRFFGPHRGTWEGAYERYPQLAELFSIASSVTPEVVLEFLHEVHESAELQPSRRLLRTCLTLLGDREVDPPVDWRIIPASDAATDHPLLVTANQVGLVRSNSPTLSGLFARTGRLLVVDPGDAETALSLDKLYQRLGIPRLRDAYTVRPDRSGREVGQEMAEAVVAFRALLRSLAAVLPRLRAARPEWEEGEWLVESRLSHFMTSGTIRVLQDLRLTYELPQVATVAVEAAAAYDPLHGELLTSAPALAQPAAHAVALAEGLLDLIYQGPGSEGLVDLLNLLIPLGRRETMDDYLDRRHFPRPFEQTATHGVRERVGEILDYGLHKLLERRFPELAGQDWAAWRRGDLLLADNPALAARALLRELGQAQPSAELLEAVVALLSAASLEDVLAPLWEQAGMPPEALSRREDLAPASAAGLPSPASRPPVTSAMIAREAAAAPPPGGLAGVGQKVLGRLGQWLGVTPTQTVGVLGLRTTIPDVADSYRHPPERHLLVSSKALQGHDLYCISMLGVDFDARRQLYLPAAVPWTDHFVASGRTLEFSGRLTQPELLPKPMYSRLLRPPVVRGCRATLRGPDALGLHRLITENPDAEITYGVELGSAPDLANGGPGLGDLDPRLLRPTAPLAALPPLVLEWISWARSSGLTSWELAQRARDFVIGHYRYDLAFLDSQDMQELANRPFKGDENRTLTMLHAGASGRHLGCGVCLELAAVLLEMLRRARIPAVLASAWMLDMGLIHVSDHAVVLVLLPSARGPIWIPLEASVDRMVRPAQAEPELSRTDLLQSATDLVLGPSFATPTEARERERAQEEALLAALGSRRRLEVLLECFARSGRYLREVDSELQWLAAKGYLTVDREELYRVSPRASRGRP
jgi:hypothetical protein